MTDESPSRSLDKFVVRLPEGMRERIAMRAKDNGRSMNTEIVAILNAVTAKTEEHILQRVMLTYLMNDQKIKELQRRLDMMKEYRERLMDDINVMDAAAREKREKLGDDPLPPMEQLWAQAAIQLDIFEKETAGDDL